MALLISAANLLPAGQQMAVRQPVLDSQGCFWVYRNGPMHPRMPFLPYGWTSDATNVSQVFQIDLECLDHPCTAIKPPVPEREFCISIKMKWSEATWAGVAFISGPDKPPWWGDTTSGWHYDLSSLPKKKLVFYARGDKGGEVIKVKIGELGDKPYGDSLIKPLSTDDLKLTQSWTRFELDLNSVSAFELTNICNGFTVLAQQASQSSSPAETQFYLDDIYYE